ncbi:MAG: type II secretion system GspH family protein [Candidatus Peribacteria bacterium]|jgi:type II secretory pathway pseudopilin PulG|nr:type II secretion system GspH family protein [Candidatus Peribacteria bacterium]
MRKAFTLVETLIVIIVFGTGILAVLYGMSQTLSNQDRAKTQITSSFLAREGIELMYNLRDSNYRRKLPRNCIFQKNNGTTTITLDGNGKEKNNPFCLSYFTGDTVLKITMGTDGNYLSIQTGELSEDFETNWENFQLFYATGTENPAFSYRYTEYNGQPLRYARYLLVKSINENESPLPANKLLKIESHVLFKKGALTGDTVMESFIGNYEIG